MIANALDSGATRVRLLTDPAAATLTIIDDGRGKQRRELARYHDIASSTSAATGSDLPAWVSSADSLSHAR